MPGSLGRRHQLGGELPIGDQGDEMGHRGQGMPQERGSDPIRGTESLEPAAAGTAWVGPSTRLRRRPWAEGGTRCYLSTSRAADAHAFVRSRMKFAWAVAILETHSMSLEPGPRSSESAIALSVDS